MVRSGGGSEWLILKSIYYTKIYVLFIFPGTDLYIHDSIYTIFQYTKVTMKKQKLVFITYCFVITFEIQKIAF
jgi:hypothetical protein